MKKLLTLILALVCTFNLDVAEAQTVPVGTTRIAQWQGDKKAAFLLMFDDGWPSHWQVGLPELKKRGMIGTFYIVPKKAEYSQFESIWLNDVVGAGMVLANHTTTHNGFQGKDDTLMEINDCTQYLLAKVPGKNPRLISFGMPGVNDYNYGGLDFKALLAQNNLIDRPTFDGHGATYHLKTLPEYLALADKAIAAGGMEYVVFHGLERITPNWGYQDMWAVPQTIFLPFLDGLQQRRDRGDLWITDHISWHKYKTERDTSTVTVLENSATQIRLDLKGTTTSGLYDLPLTIVTQVPSTWAQCTVTQGDNVKTVATPNGRLMFEALPNYAPITIQNAASTGTTARGVNAGGSATGIFVADTGFSGGTAVGPYTGTITTTGVTNPAPLGVYQSNRYGNFTYTIGGFAPNSSHVVRLHFCENYWTSSGQRTFNVAINGATVLNNFDITGAAGGVHKANVQPFTLNANSTGQYMISFTTVKDNAQINGIEIQ